MSDREIQLFDTVALLRDAPELGLLKGQVGAVVLEHDAGAVEVEFVDSDGRTYAMGPFDRKDLLRLAYEQQAAE